MPIGVFLQPPDHGDIFCGTLTTTSSTGAAITTLLSSSGTIPANGLEIFLQGRAANTVDAIIGDSNNQLVHISPGSVVTLSLAKFSKLFLKSATNSTQVDVDFIMRL